MRTRELRTFLLSNLRREAWDYFGTRNDEWLARVADMWLDDKNNSRGRYKDIERYSGGSVPARARLLDMACGCGTFVFFGLLNGLDVWGIDPQDWKLELNNAKCDVYGYPADWKSRFIKAVGERLPFPDAHFDFVVSYQTLEHVQSVDICISEMARVLKPGGALFLHAPDYRSTFEGHYRLPWLPLFPRPLARVYLRLLGRPARGLGAINYVTAPCVKQLLSRKEDIACIIDQGKDRFTYQLAKRYSVSSPFVGAFLYSFWKLGRRVIRLFRREFPIDLIVVKRG